MKRLVFILTCLLSLTMTLPSQAALSTSEIRQHARFISDRMGYELQLNNTQYNDVYEINYDFLSSIRYLADDLVYGYDSDVDQYYNYLDLRNEDLSYVLTRSQYTLFMSKDYFYSPLYLNNSRFTFRIYSVYSDVSRFFFSLPLNFYSYAGIHNRTHYRNGFYVGRYRHERYTGGGFAIRNNRDRYTIRRNNDFRVQGTPNRSNNNARPNNGNNGYRSGNNVRPNNGNNGNRGNNGWSVQPVNRPNNSNSNNAVRPSNSNSNNNTVRPSSSNTNRNNTVRSSSSSNSNSRPNVGGTNQSSTRSGNNDRNVNNNRGNNRGNNEHSNTNTNSNHGGGRSRR